LRAPGAAVVSLEVGWSEVIADADAAGATGWVPRVSLESLTKGPSLERRRPECGTATDLACPTLLRWGCAA
jgi:hypothetical protein